MTTPAVPRQGQVVPKGPPVTAVCRPSYGSEDPTGPAGAVRRHTIPTCPSLLLLSLLCKLLHRDTVASMGGPIAPTLLPHPEAAVTQSSLTLLTPRAMPRTGIFDRTGIHSCLLCTGSRFRGSLFHY